MEIQIRPADLDDTALLHAHMVRHLAESGGAQPHFLPYAPNSAELPTKPNLKATQKDLNELNWQRWFVAIAGNQVIGHVDLKGASLAAACIDVILGLELSLAIEHKDWEGA